MNGLTTAWTRRHAAGSLARLTLIATVVVVQGLRPSLANHSASFKEVAQRGGTIIMARCQADGQEKITCAALEVWRGKKPKHATVMSREDWDHFPVGGLEKRSDARFLMVVEANGDVGTCVVPILDEHLPKEFRRWYDHSQGPPLSVEQLKADLLKSTWGPFLDLARHSPCADSRNRLFVIDRVLVFWDRVGNCPDNGYGATLYGNTVDHILCYLGDSIAGPIKTCSVSSYEDMFEIMIGHRDQPDLGLGKGHTVQRLPL